MSAKNSIPTVSHVLLALVCSTPVLANCNTLIWTNISRLHRKNELFQILKHYAAYLYVSGNWPPKKAQQYRKWQVHGHSMINAILARMRSARASAFRQMCRRQPRFTYGASLLENSNRKQKTRYGHTLWNIPTPPQICCVLWIIPNHTHTHTHENPHILEQQKHHLADIQTGYMMYEWLNSLNKSNYWT